MSDTPESKTARLHSAVTPSEKRAVELVATVEQATVSELIRKEGIESLVERGSRIAAQLREMQAAA